MKKKTLFTLITLAIVTASFVGCTKEDPYVNIIETADVLESINKLAPQAQKFTENADHEIVINTSHGLTFRFPQGSFKDGAGNTITGNVDVSITEYMSNEDMLASGVTTTSGDKILQSGGMFKVDVTKNGSDVQLASVYTVNIPSASQDPNMRIFKGQEISGANGERIVDWVEDDKSWISTDSFNREGYDLNLNFLSWCNLDKYYDADDGAQVRLKLPDGFTSRNTVAYMIFDENSVTYLFGDADNKEFNSGGYNLPIGWDIKLLAVAEKNDELYYALVSSTITDPHLETVSSMTKVSEDDLQDILDSL